MPSIQCQTDFAVDHIKSISEMCSRQMRRGFQTFRYRFAIRKGTGRECLGEQALQCRIFCLTKAQIADNNYLQNTFTKAIIRHCRLLAMSAEEIIKQIDRAVFGLFVLLVCETKGEMFLETASGLVSVGVGMLADPVTVLADNVGCSVFGINDFKAFTPIL